MDISPDRCGFPMAWMDTIEAWVHCVPVTKIQFEAFLCDTAEPRFDSAWYDRVLASNARVSPGRVTASNYWRAFVTGVLPDEALAFARWCGDGFDLPTADEWQRLYRGASARSTLAAPWSRVAAAGPPRTWLMLERLAEAHGAATAGQPRKRELADDFMLRNGVMEWVSLPGSRSGFGGLGRPARGLYPSLASPDMDLVEQPATTDRKALRAYGFRLLRRGLPWNQV